MDALLILYLVLAGLIVYLIAGYPLLLMMRARKPVHKKFSPRSVTILLAVRNGEPWLAAKLTNLTELDYPPGLMEIIVISNGSTDATAAIARAWGAPVKFIEIAREGKAAALNAGMAASSGEILFFTDVRQRLSRESLRDLVACFHDPSVGVVSGELIITETDSQEERSVGLYWKYEKWIRMRLSAVDSILGATGCIYAMRRQLAPPMPDGILLDDVYLPLAAFFRGFRCILEPAAKAFDAPTSLDAEFFRKVRTQAGVYQLLRYYPGLLGPRNRLWIDFVSHKFGRLLLPWLLLSIFVINFRLPWPWRAGAWIQAAFYAFAFLDRFVPGRSFIKRLTSPLRTFVTLMAAAACAVVILLLPGERLWRPTSHGRR